MGKGFSPALAERDGTVKATNVSIVSLSFLLIISPSFFDIWRTFNDGLSCALPVREQESIDEPSYAPGVRQLNKLWSMGSLIA